MKKLGIDQRKSIGFQFLLEQMSPNTPYGLDEIKGVKPFSKGHREELVQELEELSCFVEHFQEEKRQLKQMEFIMMHMKEIRGSLKKAQFQAMNDIEFFELKNVLIQIEKIVPLFNDLKGKLNLKYINIEPVAEPLDILDPEKKRIPSFYISEAYSDWLGEIRTQKKQIEVVLRGEHTENEKERLFRQRAEIVAGEEEEEQAVRKRLTEQLREYLEMITRNIHMIGKLDFMIQKARLVQIFGGTKPEITKDLLYLEEMTNPQVAESLKEQNKKFAPVTIEVSRGATVITGANMGGKSVVLRTVALNIYLAQSGFYVFAKQGKIPMFDYLFMIAEEFQSTKDGLSSFGGEIVKLKEALDKVDKGYGFLMLDELARGTNPDEGARIVQAVVRYLNRQNTMTLLATHYDHVAEFADKHYQVYGLKRKSMESLEAEIEAMEEKDRIGVIAKYMDYGIYEVTGELDCPRDATNVCYLLGLQKEVMEYLQQE